MTDQNLTRRRALQSALAAAGAFSLFSAEAQDSKEVRIGQSAHLTGPLAATLRGPLRGQELAVDEVNRKGGIGGRPMRIITLDDGYDPKRSIDNTRKLIDEEKVVALFGYANTSAVAAVFPLLQEKAVPLIGTYSGSPSLRVKHHPFFFTTLGSYRDEVVQMVRLLVAQQKTQLAVVYQNHPFGQQMLPVVEAVAKEFGATIVAKAPIESSGADAVACAQAIAPAKPHAVLLMAFGPGTVPTIRAIKAYVGAPMYAIAIANSKSAVEALADDGRGMAYTHVTPYPWRPVSKVTRDFTAEMERAGLPIDYDHFLGYLNTKVLIEGLRRAAAGGKAVTPASVTAGMEAIGKYDMGGYLLNFSPTRHHGSSFVEITILGPRGRYIK
ncbi:MAG: hypothetical protein RLZZ618_2222 [Pseudomonadota bacterium]|jgi:ABC-type branched-subunit amino acid transport system substrate-binding protein